MVTVNPFADDATPTTCTWVKQCLIPFADGMFPGWVHRDVYGDKVIRADDTVMIAKVPPLDAPAAGYAWGTVLWPDTPASLAQVIPVSATSPVTGQPVTPWHPVTPSLPPIPEPELPCCVIREPEPELPPVAPVPVPASAGLLIAAVALLFIIRRKS